MKIGTTLSLALAAAGLLALAAPADAQNHRGGGGGNMGGSMNHGGGNFNRGHFVGGRGGYYWHGRWYGGDRFNFYVGGIGYPWWGWGYPYYAYGYYPYPPPYGYYGPGYGQQQGVYNGKIANPRENSDGKDTSSVPQRVQRQLAEAGYYHGPIDGVIGDGTQRAIRNYQRDNGLPVTGHIDDSLLNSMGRS